MRARGYGEPALPRSQYPPWLFSWSTALGKAGNLRGGPARASAGEPPPRAGPGRGPVSRAHTPFPPAVDLAGSRVVTRWEAAQAIWCRKGGEVSSEHAGIGGRATGPPYPTSPAFLGGTSSATSGRAGGGETDRDAVGGHARTPTAPGAQITGRTYQRACGYAVLCPGGSTNVHPLNGIAGPPRFLLTLGRSVGTCSEESPDEGGRPAPPSTAAQLHRSGDRGGRREVVPNAGARRGRSHTRRGHATAARSGGGGGRAQA